MQVIILIGLSLFFWLAGCLYLGAALFIGEAARRFFGLQPGVARKFVHLLIGCSIWPVVLYRIAPVNILVVGLTAAAAVGLEYYLRLFQSLDHWGNHGRAGGMLMYIAAYILCYWIFYNDPVFAVSGIMALAIGDAAAAVAGKGAARQLPGIGWSNRKTVRGSLAMFCSSAVVIIISMVILHPPAGFYTVIDGLLAALAATLAEAYLPGNYDNLAIPLVTAAALVLSSFLW